MYNLVGKTALVTGAGSGIGRAIARRLAEEGCDIAILDIDREAADEVAGLVREAGRRAVAEVADVSDPEQVNISVGACLNALGKIDILVNNAGIAHISTLLEMSPADWRDTFRVNVDGVFHCCKVVPPQMIERKYGRVINLASWIGKSGQPYYSAYCASKFAVIGVTQSLAREMAVHNITVNAICPGIVTETAMRERAEVESRKLGLASAAQRESNIPLGRLALPDDVAAVAAFLASEEAAYMTGQAINATGGLWMH